MYFDRPIPLDEYLSTVLINPDSKLYTLKNQDYNSNEDDQVYCSYSEFRLEEAKQNILSSQENKPSFKDKDAYKTAKEAVLDFRKKYFTN
jgi:hypothetical protein